MAIIFSGCHELAETSEEKCKFIYKRINIALIKW